MDDNDITSNTEVFNLAEPAARSAWLDGVGEGQRQAG